MDINVWPVPDPGDFSLNFFSLLLSMLPALQVEEQDQRIFFSPSFSFIIPVWNNFEFQDFRF